MRVTSTCRALVATAVALSLVGCAGGGEPASPAQPTTPPSWTSVDPDPSGPGGPSILVEWHGRLVGVGDRSADGPSSVLWSSADGTAYATTDLPAPGAVVASDIVAGADGLLAVGGVWAGEERQVATTWRSTDGVAWSRSADDPGLQPASGYRSTWLRWVAATAAGFVGVGTEWGDAGQHVVAWRSADGSSWVRSATELGGVNPNAIVVAGRRIVLAATDWPSWGGHDGEAGMFWWSDDAGATWTRSGPSVDNVVPVALAVGPAGLVAVGYRWTGSSDWTGMGSVPAVWSSVDGQAWSTDAWSPDTGPWPLATPMPSQAAPVQGSRLWAVLGGSAGYLAVGSHDGIAGPWAGGEAQPTMRSAVELWTSTKGRTWVGAGGLVDLVAVGSGGGATGRMASIGGRTTIVVRSLNGTTIWSARP